MQREFTAHIEKGYAFEGDTIILGTAMLDQEAIENTLVRLPLKMMNRHGLISGATGTGKTKTAQILAEQFSLKGVPSLLMDMKSDLSGVAVPGENNKHIEWRHGKIGIPFEAGGSPVEFLSISDEPGVRMRSTITEFGPILLSKILSLNNTQQSVLTVLFKFADDEKIPLIDLEDLKDLLQFASTDGKEKIENEYGYISPASVGAMMRKLIELQQQGADRIFGEPSFEVNDLLRKDEQGKGMVNILRLSDIQSSPKHFSTFMLQLLAEVYTTFPEEGDMDKPKLAIFIDEAHLVFEEASKVLLDQIEMIIKLIRSKGVGIFFITQNPTDIPQSVLSQLGLKIQHALRAFTARDRKAIRMVADNYPLTDYYEVDRELTELGTGEALITTLNEKGRPTPLVRTLLRAPQSRMDVLTPQELQNLVAQSNLISKYNVNLTKENATNILKKKIENAQTKETQKELKRADKKVHDEKGSGWLDVLKDAMDTTAGRQVSRTIAREITRGFMGILGSKK